MSNEYTRGQAPDTDPLPFRAPAMNGIPESMPHLMPLPDSAWAVWRWAALRGAGFPAREALALAAPEICTTQADRLLLVQPVEQERLSADFQKAFSEAQIHISRVIQNIARSERFQEAILWQNRRAFHTGVAHLLHISPESTHHLSQKRQHEILVARYLQRYCMKNDTIGFFGPVGWTRLVDDPITIDVRTGSSLLASRQVYFEQWGIHALAKSIARNHAFRPWLKPRRMPHLRLEKTILHFPFGRTMELTPGQARILHACDGRQAACRIAAQVAPGSAGEEETYRVLEQFQSARYITWTLDISPESSFPEQLLRQQLEDIGDDVLRTSSLEMLDALEKAKDAVATADEDIGRLDAALENLDTTFSMLTAAEATRFHGKMYAGRTLIYEDCRRDVEMCLGSHFVWTLGQPLALLLTSARWFTYELARLYRKAFSQAYQELADQMGTPLIDFTSFWFWIQPLLFDENKLLTKQLLPVFQQKWAEVFASVVGKEESPHLLQYTTEELRSSVLTAFAAPGPGWRSACYHNPDILIQASNLEAIRQGDYFMVLGEFHMATNTLQSQLFVLQHPSPERLLENISADLPERRMLPIIGREVFPLSRTRPGLVTPKDIRFIYTGDAMGVPRTEVVPISEFLLEQTSRGLLVRTQDQRWSFDIIEIVAEFLSQMAGDCFQIRAPGKHLPRVTIDHLVVARESWVFLPTEIDFLRESISQADCFLAARRWKNANHLPRFTFFSIPGETKPCFLDLESPLYIEHFRRMARRLLHNGQNTTPLFISEMIPTPEQLWLPDAEGRRYTSEIRLVAVDTERAHADV